MIIALIGLPNSGKREIADAIRDRTSAIHLKEEDITSIIGDNLLTHTEISKCLGNLARMLESKQDKPIVVDLVCATHHARKAFGDCDVLVWVDTVTPNKNDIWEDPETYDHRIINTGDDHEDALPTRAITVVRKYGMLDWKEDAVFMMGAFQPWNSNDKRIYEEASKRGKNVVIGVKNTTGMTEKDPLSFDRVKGLIHKDIPSSIVIKVPNIKHIVYSRDSGYRVEEVDFGL